jgi:hypothetical protein
MLPHSLARNNFIWASNFSLRDMLHPPAAVWRLSCQYVFSYGKKCLPTQGNPPLAALKRE